MCTGHGLPKCASMVVNLCKARCFSARVLQRRGALNVCAPFDSASYGLFGRDITTACTTPASGDFSKTTEVDIITVDTGALKIMRPDFRNQQSVCHTHGCAEAIYTPEDLQLLQRLHTRLSGRLGAPALMCHRRVVAFL